jgi:hypothetical protein
MGEKRRKVVFASENLEKNYKRLASSGHPEDRRSYRVLQKIRSELRINHKYGKRIP